MDNNLSKIVGMSSPRKKADVAHRAVATMGAAEAILLDVGNALHDEADCPKDDPGDIAACSKVWLVGLRDVGRVQKGYR